MNIYLEDFVDKKFKKPGKALDLGAGKFFDVACLEQLGWKCNGVDLKSGVNLEEQYISNNKPFDLVYSNYLLHKIKNRKNLIVTAYKNLKQGGWLFLHSFDKSDKNSSSRLTQGVLKSLLEEQGFKNVATRKIDYYDNETGHKHWHKILEAIAQK